MKLPVLQSRMAVHEALPPMPVGFGAAGLPRLTDARDRAYSYLRLSVTDRCDLACVYCMPPSGEDEHALRRDLLSFEEASRLVEIAAAMGIRRVRLTGGEPLVRRDIVMLVDQIRRGGVVDDVVMTTNATRLAELARPLREAGLSGVNVSLDSLDPDRFRRMTRGGELSQVLAGIHAAIDVGFVVKLNVVVVRGENDEEAAALVDFAWAHGITPRFIELMPLGEAAKLGEASRVTAAELEARLGERLGPKQADRAAHHGPARYRAAADGSSARVGFITPLSNEFCDDCNRIRITAKGDVRACLASRKAVSLRDLMRAGASDAEVAWALHAALGSKTRGHEFLDASETEHTHVGMSLIGG
jgi:cyclic pyranopterin phosphate synthase